MDRRMTRREVVAGALAAPAAAGVEREFRGRYVRGRGNERFLRLLDTSYRMLWPDAYLQNISMLYTPTWNGFVEGPTWNAWWVQNSYGPTYCGLPFFQEPYVTWIENCHHLWFSQMGDGKRKGYHDWVAPDGCLCDAASPGWIVYKQGDGRIDIHDWGLEFTAAGVVMQAEALLISRDRSAIRRYLPLLARCARLLWSRHDSSNHLFLAGPAANLLAPSYAGWRRPDGTYGMAYLAGLSITFIAAMDRLIALERLAGSREAAARYTEWRDLARSGLRRLASPDGYFVKSLDPDGTPHGVVGAAKHGYLEAVCNHDAIAFGVADDAQAERIMAAMERQPGLRRHHLVITNDPGLDDLYTEPVGLWEFGRWVNGGHWTTCEARMILAYYRTGRFEAACRSMEQILRFARQFRLDNPLVEFGNAPYQPDEPINTVYDSWGAPTAMLRGLFEYQYGADRLTLVPRIPPGVSRLEQHFPARCGRSRLWIAAEGAGPVTGVWLNGTPWREFTANRIHLDPLRLEPDTRVLVGLGGSRPGRFAIAVPRVPPPAPPQDHPLWKTARSGIARMGNGQPLRIGADSQGGSRFHGEIRRIRLYNRALTEEEIARSAAEPSIGAFRGAVVDLDIGRATHALVPNRAAADLAGRVVGGCTVLEGEYPALRLDGAGHVEVPASPRLTLEDALTLEAWVRPERFEPSGMRVIDRVTAGRNDGYLLDIYPGNALRLITERGTQGYAAGLQAGEWVHLAGRVDPKGGLALYVNGRRVAGAPAAPSPSRRLERAGVFWNALRGTPDEETWEARQAWLIVETLGALRDRRRLEREGRLPPLAPKSRAAAERLYLETAEKLLDGLAAALERYRGSKEARRARLWRAWAATEPAGARPQTRRK